MKGGMRMKKIGLATVLACAVAMGAGAMDWNDYDASERFAPGEMHQGNYVVQRVTTARVQLSREPLYVITVKQFAVSPDKMPVEKGSIRYRLNYETKEVWVFQNDTQDWLPIAAVQESERKAIDKAFVYLYGIPFFTGEK